MDFTTKIPISKTNSPMIDYASKIVLLGSCFSENIGEKFQYFKFQITVNPFGIIFNPVSLAKILQRSSQQNHYTENDIFFHNDLWHCFEVHSELSNPSKETLLNSLNKLLESTNKHLHNATHIIITLGTAWVYLNKETEEMVANCHKVPQKQFVKELISVNDVSKSLEILVRLLKNLNPNVKIIFTVSPVRHLKDGFIENTQSKAHLITALHQFLANDSTSFYFPSYEIMMDELRDYRFYAEDLLHPNQTAINYIWEKFKNAWISKESFATMELVETIQKGLKHKPFNPTSEAHQKFLNNLEKTKKELQTKYEHIVF